MKSLFFKLFCIILTIVLLCSGSPFTAFAVDLDYMNENREEGERLWQNYLEAIEPIKNGEYPKYTEFIELVITSDLSPQHYADLTYRSEQEYLDMTTYDKILWNSIIVYPFSRQNNGGNYYNSLDGWKGYAMDAYSRDFKLFCSDEDSVVMLEAYSALMEWLYYYYESTGAFYNFIEDKDSIDYINDYYDSVEKEKSTEKDTEEKDTDDTVAVTSVESKEEQVSSVPTRTSGEAISAVNSEVVKEERGIWSNFLDNLKSHLFTVILASVFVVLSIGLVIYKKRFNINKEE